MTRTLLRIAAIVFLVGQLSFSFFDPSFGSSLCEWVKTDPSSTDFGCKSGYKLSGVQYIFGGPAEISVYCCSTSSLDKCTPNDTCHVVNPEVNKICLVEGRSGQYISVTPKGGGDVCLCKCG